MTTTTSQTEAPEKALFVCPPDHRHGRTITCYKTHRCRCDPCRARCAKVERARNQAKREGRYQGGFSGVSECIVHITVLYRDGMTYKQIADRAGVSEPTVLRIMTGKTTRILRTTERAILAVRLHIDRTPGVKVDALGTKRRLQALIAIGYTSKYLSERLGRDAKWVSGTMTRSEVTEESRVAVDRLFRELAMTPAAESGQSRRMRTYAAKYGYVSPLAWDDIDDPDETPAEMVREKPYNPRRFDQSVVDVAVYGDRPRLSPPERREAIRILNERRWSAKQIGEHLGCSDRTVDRIRKELALPIYLYNATTLREAA